MKAKNRRTDLVLNKAIDAKLTSNVIQSITANVSTSLIRNDTMEGKDFVVAPMVMVVEGVLPGSNGPLLYSSEELSKVPEVWNHKPVVVYHPTMNGKGISACDPDVLTQHKVGYIFNTKFEDGKLKAEAWIDINRANDVDARIVEAIQNEQTMELSTGLFADYVPEPGEFDGVSYDAIAVNYKPDHLALLPDQIGACSVEAGAGFIRNKKEDEPNAVFNRVYARALKLAINALSHGSIYDAIWSALNKKYTSDDEYRSLWVTDVYDSYFVYEVKNKYYRQNYTVVDEKDIEFVNDPIEVERVISYKTVDGSMTDNQTAQTTNNKKETEMKREMIVNHLIQNCGWSEADRETLMNSTDEELLAKMKPVTNKGKDAPSKAVTVEEYVENAPDESMKEVLQNGLQAHKRDKDAEIEKITANQSNAFSKDELEAKSLDELKKISALVTENKAEVPSPEGQAPSYAGQGEQIVDNSSADSEALGLPSMDFSS